MRKLLEDRVTRLLELHDAGEIRLSEKEEAFLQDCINRYGDPEKQLSDRQEEWVNGMYDREVAGGGRG